MRRKEQPKHVTVLALGVIGEVGESILYERLDQKRIQINKVINYGMHGIVKNALTRNQDTTALDKKYKTTAQCSHKEQKEDAGLL